MMKIEKTPWKKNEITGCKLKSCPNYNVYSTKYCSDECKKTGRRLTRNIYYHRHKSERLRMSKSEKKIREELQLDVKEFEKPEGPGKEETLEEEDNEDDTVDGIEEDTEENTGEDTEEIGLDKEDDIEEPEQNIEKNEAKEPKELSINDHFNRLYKIRQEIDSYISLNYDSEISLVIELERFFKYLKSTKRHFLDYNARGEAFYEALNKCYERLYKQVHREEDKELREKLLELIDAYEEFKLSFDLYIMEMEQE